MSKTQKESVLGGLCLKFIQEESPILDGYYRLQPQYFEQQSQRRILLLRLLNLKKDLRSLVVKVVFHKKKAKV